MCSMAQAVYINYGSISIIYSHCLHGFLTSKHVLMQLKWIPKRCRSNLADSIVILLSKMLDLEKLKYEK